MAQRSKWPRHILYIGLYRETTKMLLSDTSRDFDMLPLPSTGVKIGHAPGSLNLWRFDPYV